MKKILLVYTGGTIGSSFDEEKNCRVLSSDFSKMSLLSEYQKSNKLHCSIENLFEDSNLEECHRTLSENMTYSKLNTIIEHIKKTDTHKYCGIIVLHGSDTLAYTAALFSFVFSDIKIPIILVCGKRPPDDKETNAHINFKTAVDLILKGIAPNVYVPYENSDGNIWLHLGTSIMQCQNYSDDFFGAFDDKSFCLNEAPIEEVLKKCNVLSLKRKKSQLDNPLNDGVLLILPYMGINYSCYNLDGVKAVVHGSYHSGTVCVERNNEAEDYSSHSLLWLAKECEKRKIPIFVAPSILNEEQYSSMADLTKNTSVKLLDMTTEMAYATAIVAVSSKLENDELIEYVCNFKR